MAKTRFSDRLRKNSEPFWRQSVEHRFTRELIDDTLQDTDFALYLIQDYAFMDTLARVLESAIDSAPDATAKNVLSGFLKSITGDEEDYFLRSFDALGISKDIWRKTKRTTATRRLSDIMLDAARKGYAEAIVALLPVEWVYWTWANAAGDTRPKRFYLAEWIEIHANPDFTKFVEWLRVEADNLGPALPPEQRVQLAGLFREIVQLEVAFFDTAYT